MAHAKQMTDPALPSWARRLQMERKARSWSQSQVVRNLRAASARELPSDESMLRKFRDWEAGQHKPDEEAQQLLAAVFGTVTAALFPPEDDRGNGELLSTTGMDTLELVSRLRATDVDTATLDAMQITADRLCSEYPHQPAGVLMVEGKQWLQRILGMVDQRLTIHQHRQVLSLAGQVALLVGCVEYDMGDTQAAESTRRAALSLGTDADDRHVMGWAHEMTAWFGLTQGSYRRVIAASDQGQEVAASRGVSVQLAAQKAKAWARLGNVRQVEVALDRGRQLLEQQPYPDNVDHHFVVDPDKWDFYSMDAYRLLGHNDLVENYASEVLRLGTRPDGVERSPMRNAEAQVTLGVVAARRGDLDAALSHGRAALSGGRQSVPSLIMVGQELATALTENFPGEASTEEYMSELRRVGAH